MNTQIPAGIEKRNSRFFYGYIIVAAALILWISAWGTNQGYGVFFKSMAAELGWTRLAVSGAVSLGSVARALFGAMNGRLCDRFGPRKVITIGGAFLGIGYFLMSGMNSQWNLYLYWGLVSALGFSVVGPALMSTVSRWFVKRRGLMIAIVSSGAGIGGIIFAPLAAWLAETYGWRNGWLVMGVVVLVAMVASGLFLKRDPAQTRQLPDGASEQLKQEKNKHNTTVKIKKGLTLKEALSTGQFWALSFVLLCFGFNRGIIVHIAPHVTDLGFSLTIAGSVLAVNSGVSIAGRLLMGHLSDIIGGRKSLIISFVLFPAAFLVLLLSREIWSFYVWAVLFGVAWGGIAVLRFSTAGELFGVGSLGSIMGIIEMFATVGSGITPLLAGWLYDVTHSYQIVFYISITTGILGFIISWLLKPVARKQA